MQIVCYEVVGNDIKVGFKNNNFVVYGMIGVELTSGLTKNQIIQKVYEKCKSAIEYESNQTVHAIIGEGLTGESFTPAPPKATTVAISGEEQLILSDSILYQNYTVEVKDNYGELFNGGVSWTLEEAINGIVIDEGVLTIDPVKVTKSTALNINATCNGVIGKFEVKVILATDIPFTETEILKQRLLQAEADNLTTLEALAEVYEMLLALQ